MLEVSCRKRMLFFRIKDIYYAREVEVNHPGYDAVYYYNCRKPARGAKESKTMLIDLDRESEALLESFSKKTRAQVKKSLQEDCLLFEYIVNPSEKDLADYCSGYDLFAVQKGILPCHMELIEKAFSLNKLVIARAIRNGEILCHFALLDAGDRVVCYHGYNIRFSCQEDPEKVKLISMANRGLEYHCMLKARDQGKRYYDFCGLTLDPDNASAEMVDHYKKGFKGDIASEYHVLQPITTRGWIYSLLVNFRNSFRSLHANFSPAGRDKPLSAALMKLLGKVKVMGRSGEEISI